ncbi:MAG: SulP family inorganic anion transporter [Ignavibacteriaceae bacterium]
MKQTREPAVQSGSKYRWFVAGDINGFFGLMVDNLTVLSFLAGILIIVFKYPAEIVYGKMFPGTAFGVLFGDLVYTYMAFRLAKKTNNPNVTAMPLGLDTPSTIGIALTVLGPSFIYLKSQGMAVNDAAMMTWYIGMATMMIIGIVKVIFSFIGGWIQKIVPQAGLLGSLAGIGLLLIGFIPLLDVFGLPVIGMISLGLILYTLVAKINLPKKFPGVLAAVLIGTVLYYILAPMGLVGGSFTAPAMKLHYGVPLPTLGFVHGFIEALKYIPIALPFAILTIVGGINVTESARVAGDDYNTKHILLTEAFATIIAGLCGGVAQTTPYIGQPAYKAMGSRAGYTVLTGLFIGLGGILGYVSFFVELIPRAVLAPILIFVALDITVQAFKACPPHHMTAVAFSLFPNIARMLQIKLSNPDVISIDKFNQLLTLPGKVLPETLVVVALGNGFILTAMLWGAFVAKLIDRKLKQASVYLGIMAVLTFFGVIHSAIPEGNMYFPWQLQDFIRQIPYQFSSAYLILAVMLFLLSFTKESKEAVNFSEY